MPPDAATRWAIVKVVKGLAKDEEWEGPEIVRVLYEWMDGRVTTEELDCFPDSVKACWEPYRLRCVHLADVCTRRELTDAQKINALQCFRPIRESEWKRLRTLIADEKRREGYPSVDVERVLGEYHDALTRIRYFNSQEVQDQKHPILATCRFSSETSIFESTQDMESTTT
jgi:hypothetical protein